MQTRCPSCKTVFRIRKGQLKQSDGLVRCGQCNKTFNGYDELLSTKEKAAYSPEMLKNMLLGKPTSSPAATVTWSLVLTIAGFCLAAQILYMQREWLVKQPLIGNHIDHLCQQLAWCEIRPQRDLSRIQLVSRNVYSHPNIDNALMVNAVITNTAAASQPYPTVLVSLANVRGQTVAQRYFLPGEYLPEATHDDELMEPGKSISINLEVMDPGQNAMSFELDFI